MSNIILNFVLTNKTMVTIYTIAKNDWGIEPQPFLTNKTPAHICPL